MPCGADCRTLNVRPKLDSVLPLASVTLMPLVTRFASRPMPRLPRAMMPPAPVAFLDIETTGLGAASATVTLVGILTREGAGRRLQQFFVDEPRAEREVLAQVVSRLAGLGGVVTFNGHSFDLPFLRERAKRYGLRLPWLEGWDLLHEARRWRRTNGSVNDCRLSTMLAHFGISRVDHSSGLDVISAYWDWVNKKKRSARRLILDHNAEDVLLLPDLAARLVQSSRRTSNKARKPR